MIRRISIRREKSYKEILQLQESEFEKRIICKKHDIAMPGDIVFFVEHRPVFTLGRHGKPSNLYADRHWLCSHNIEFVETDRGGDITYHGPGQITVYPIIDLQRYHLGVKDYVNLLEETVIQTISDYGIKGQRIEGKTGVWVKNPKYDPRKISAIGIKCSRFVTMHGFALNVGPDLSLFSQINPCGLNMEVTSISKEIGNTVSIDEVEEKLWRRLSYLLQLHIPSPGNSLLPGTV